MLLASLYSRTTLAGSFLTNSVIDDSRIRLFGVDTPELGEPCFAEATERFKDLAGEIVRVEFGSRQEDRYGRILYYVYT